MGENEKRVLYLNLSIGFCHETTATASDIITRLGWRSHPRFYTTATEDCSLIETKFLRNYDVIIFYTTGELPLNEDQKRALLDFVREGKGFVGIHSAIDTFYQWHEYGEMIGGYFNGHPWHQKVGIIIEDKDHPATRHLGDYWEVVDEIYQAKDWTREK